MIKNIEKYPIIRDVHYTPEDLIAFEDKIVDHWEAAKIRGPVHLANGNEKQLIEIFKRISPNDWVFSSWRSHYHVLLKGISEKWLEEQILLGKSITICNIEEKFYSTGIVGSVIPIACGVAMSLKQSGRNEKVWCFIGDMSFETGTFYEIHKYVRNFGLPLHFVVEDNGVSTYTPTDVVWGGKKREVPDDVIWYQYKSKWPHYGTHKWVVF